LRYDREFHLPIRRWDIGETDEKWEGTLGRRFEEQFGGRGRFSDRFWFRFRFR
jgi:hypothetical protein